MKEFLKGLLALLGAIVVTVIITLPGIVWAFLHSIHRTFELKDLRTFLKLAWRFIDGNFAAIGYIMYHIGIGLDMTWNINAGELIEDGITHKEDNHFGEKNITVSACVGELELQEDGLNKTGFGLSKTLNIAFNQKRHAVDSWLYREAEGKLRAQYFHRLRERVEQRRESNKN